MVNFYIEPPNIYFESFIWRHHVTGVTSTLLYVRILGFLGCIIYSIFSYRFDVLSAATLAVTIIRCHWGDQSL